MNTLVLTLALVSYATASHIISNEDLQILRQGQAAGALFTSEQAILGDGSSGIHVFMMNNSPRHFQRIRHDCYDMKLPRQLQSPAIFRFVLRNSCNLEYMTDDRNAWFQVQMMRGAKSPRCISSPDLKCVVAVHTSTNAAIVNVVESSPQNGSWY